MVMLTFSTLANIIFYLSKNDYLLKEHQAQKSNLLSSSLLLIVPARCQEKPGKERQTKIKSTVYFHFCYFPERQSTQRFTVFINQPTCFNCLSYSQNWVFSFIQFLQSFHLVSLEKMNGIVRNMLYTSMPMHCKYVYKLNSIDFLSLIYAIKLDYSLLKPKVYFTFLRVCKVHFRHQKYAHHRIFVTTHTCLSTSWQPCPVGVDSQGSKRKTVFFITEQIGMHASYTDNGDLQRREIV